MASLTLIFTLGQVGSKFNWQSEDQCQRTHSKWVFVFIPHLKCKYSHLILSKLSQKSATCSRQSSWLRIVLVRSLRSALLATAWLVKSMTYFDLIGQIGGCGLEFQHSKYKFSSHPKALELMAWHTPSGLVLGLCLVLMLCWGWDLPAVWRRHSPWYSGQALLGGAGHVVEQGWF